MINYQFIIKNLFITATVLFAVSGCASMDFQPDADSSFPKTRSDLEMDKIGKLSGEDGVVVSGGKGRTAAKDGINVNSYLWRAALDVAHKMPLLSADPFGGTIITDWHSMGKSSKERFKLNILIIGPELRSDAVRVSAFKQMLQNGHWVDAETSPALAIQIEEKILLAARNFKYSSVGKK